MAQSAGFGAPSTRRCLGDDRGGFDYPATSPRNQRAQKGGDGLMADFPNLPCCPNCWRFFEGDSGCVAREKARGTD